MDWNKVKADYISSDIPLRQLAKKHEVSFNTLKTRAVKEQWYALRQQKDNAATTKLLEKLSEKGASIDEKYFTLVDKLLDRAGTLIESMPEWNVASIKDMASAMKSLKECKGVKSDLELREQEARICNLEKQANADEQTNKHIVIQIDGDLNKYSK